MSIRRDRGAVWTRWMGVGLAAGVVLLGMATHGRAQEPSATELAKATQNPVADLISLPFQNNTGFETGPRDRTANVLNIQPVVPVSIGEDWLLISRLIFPIASVPSFAPGQPRRTGTGDTTYTGFASPKAQGPAGFTWGVGPVVNLPTASDDRLGADAWGLGASVVALAMPGPFVVGALANNIWSLEGSDYSRFLVQPFVNYNLADGWSLVSAPIITADWDADHDGWTVPIGGGFGKVHRFEGLPPISFGLQAYYNVERPQFGADWSTRVVVALLFPR